MTIQSPSKSELKRRASTDPFWAAERIYELEEQIKIAVEALEHYADEKNYGWIYREHTRIAQTALAEIRGEK